MNITTYIFPIALGLTFYYAYLWKYGEISTLMTGVVAGAGALIGGLISYWYAKKFHKHPDKDEDEGNAPVKKNSVKKSSTGKGKKNAKKSGK